MATDEEWVNEQLFDVLGMSDRHIGQFILSLAKKSSDRENLLEKIRSTGAVDVNSSKVIHLFIHIDI